MELWTLLFAGLGVAMFLEGLPYFIAPAAVRRYMQQVALMSDRALRGIGFGLIVAGLLVAYFALH